MPTPGPLSLLVGATSTASLVYLDQNGNPMPSTFVPPPVSFSIDQPSVVSSAPQPDSQTDLLTALADGTANLTANVTSAEGLALSAAAVINVTSAPPPPAVLSSIALQFS